ncbi:MAG: class I SAM-dependent RNA methyltransferase [Spirochaetaceae bacterium]|nr:class I SAM-dependent RNA methyltransferase [Spirochaetaceae bacterium]
MAEIITIETEKMIYGGDCIGKHNGKNVFVPFALPNETLEVEITDDRADFSRAKIVNIKKPSEHRREPKCALYGVCGGCNMQHIDDDFQIELRKQILRDSFERAGITVPEIIAISGNPFAYRSRFQFHDGSLMEKSSAKSVAVKHCPIAVSEINEWLENAQKSTGRVHVFGDKRIVGEKKVIEAIENRQKNEKPSIIGGAKRKIKRKENTYFSGTLQSPENRCEIELAGKKIAFDARGFFQSNLAVLEKSIEKVTDNLFGERVLDLFAGCGTFSVFLADNFRDVTLVEHNRDALVFAEQNLAGKTHTSYGMSGEQFLKTQWSALKAKCGQFDAVVVDPPRSGMEKAVVEWLSEEKTHQIRAVSCDPATQARDVSALVKSGYTLTRLYLLDFYPQTSHIESLACLENRE